MLSKQHYTKHQGGFSLIELMIAVLVGLIVVGAVTGVFLSSSRNYTQDDLVSRMQENARYALHVLSQDLSMAGYWGPLMSGQDINTNVRDCTQSTQSSQADCLGLYQNSTLPTISSNSDCAPGMAGVGSNWILSIGAPIEFFQSVSTGSAANADYGCIASSGFEPGSDILAIKRVDGDELKSDRYDGTNITTDDGDLFIRTDGTDAMLFDYNHAASLVDGSGISDWRYIANIYYIRNYFSHAGDGIPTLVRKKLTYDPNLCSSIPCMATEPGGVAKGIEYFHVMFGIDTDGDATANEYTSTPTLAQLDKVTSAHIYVLARSASADPQYVNDRTYHLGDVTKDFSTSPDHYYRRVFTTTVTLPNERNRILTLGN